MENKNFNPWFVDYVKHFKKESMAHAQLVSGKKGIGKYKFVETLAQSILCIASDELFQSCGHCISCKTFNSKSNPDYHLIKPEKDGGIIKIGQLRGDSKKDGDEKGIIKIAFETPLLCSSKIIVIDEADGMNMEAQNLILKTLEEPSKDTFIFLISSKPFSLKATLISRLNHTLVSNPSKKSIDQWVNSNNLNLKEEDKKILKYMDLNYISDDALQNEQNQINNFSDDLNQSISAKQIEKIANNWDDEFLLKRLTWFEEIILNAIYVQLEVDVEIPDFFSSNVNYLSKNKTLVDLFEYSKSIKEYIADLSNGINLNNKIQIKSLMSRF